MKKLHYIIFSCLSFFLCLFVVNASNTGFVTGDGVRLRSAANTNASILKTLNYGAKLTILKTVSSSDVKACSKWYQATYSTTTGYICADYVQLDTTTSSSNTGSYEKELAKFPSAYQTKIKALHSIYPNAIFTPFNTGVAWNTMLSAEYTKSGRSLLYDTIDEGYFSTDSWSYNYKTNKFTTFSGGRWIAASKQSIGYYLDPRNFLTEKNIFMFEYLAYDSKIHTKAGVQKLLEGTFMATKKVDGKKSYADVFMEAASASKVSPYYLASRVRQEQGTGGTSGLISGNYNSTYKGYYNYYNINATGTTTSQVITNGLKYAKSEGWNTQYKALVEGAKWIAKGYINIGQNTNYLQKWDAFGPQYGLHQYMQNIQAPVNESATTYKSYSAISGYKKLYYVFSIPVYTSMPSSTSLPKKGNPNNYLKSLTVNGSSVPKFDGATTSYTVTVPSGSTSVQVAASKVYSGSSVSGLGTIKLTSDSQKLNVKVTAKNGAVRTYSITVKRSSTNVEIDQIVNAAGLTRDGSYLGGVAIGTKADSLKTKINNKGGSTTVKSSSGSNKTSAVLATGDKVTVTSGGKSKTYTLIIYGDASGDGKITSLDYVKIKNNITGQKKLSGAYKEAADPSKDGKITSLDYVKVKNHITGKKKINQ